ncbi:UNVERIFIED_CONTAM: hypothetical protein Sradi_4545200 [Sesamum radiatum]|uniref:Helitron helicase-like domain-containing protein n=1 Tax=Sesamum radiatum TaxID=300843 RepID=A0AAW2NBN6_SESRA
MESEDSNMDIDGNQGVVPLACSIPIQPIADGNRSVTSTSVAQTSGSAINTTVGTTLLRQIPLANFAQVPANQLEASTSRAQPSNNRGSATDRVVGNILLRHILAPNFDRVPPNQFEASTSRARPSNSGENRLQESNGLDGELVDKIRGAIPSILLHGGRLLQQYVVDNYVKIETQKLRWVRFHQHDIRAELYEGLQDCLDAGENDAGNVGCRTILPSSFIGSPRDMFQRYQDAMAIVQKFGKPDVFLTMTCNPSWEEIKRELLPGQTAQDRPDLLTRIFRAKCEELKEDIFHRGILGKAVAHVHVIEFQKRGLPHVHMLVIFDEDDKLNTPDDYDCIVRAEIPKQDEEPELYATVIKHMIHGPYGHIKPNAPCMKNGKCKKGYPKQFAECTMQGNDSYPIYQRRNDNRLIALDNHGEVAIDNSWVVPLILGYYSNMTAT